MRSHPLLACCALALSTSALHAQGPNSAIAPDFHLTDIDGVERSLYAYLDQGKTVVLDMFATWCSPCANSQPGVQALWNAHGPNGDNTVEVMGLELDGVTTDEADWRDFFNITYPVIRAESLWLVWHPNVYPTFAIVCPDRSWHLVQQDIGSNPAPILAHIGQCAHAAAGNDARAVDFRGPFFGCTTGVVQPLLRIQNVGTQPMTSCTIETRVNGVLQSTYAWTGMLTSFQLQDSVALPPIPAQAGEMDLDFRITDVNGGPDADPTDNGTEQVIDQLVEGTAITLQIHFDNAPYEIKWTLFDAGGNVVHAHDYYNDTPGGSTVSETWQLQDHQCYRFEIDDYFGDGICCYDGAGWWRLKDANNTVAHQGGQFDFTDGFSFIPDASAGIGVHASPTWQLAPDPAGGTVTVGPLRPGATVQVLDAAGRVLSVPVTERYEDRLIDVAGLANGPYLVRVADTKGGMVKRLIVQH